jgi:DNA-binding LacI/PurR family transcriptional regulator
VAPATRKRVLQVCKRLNYRPNASARTLRTRVSKTVGVIVPDLRNAFWIDVVGGIEQVINAAGFDLLIANSNEELGRLGSEARAMASRLVDGLLIAPTVGSGALVRTLRQEIRHLVLLDRLPPGLTGTHSVVINNEAGAYQATRHLIESGHARIGLLAGNINLDTGLQRLTGYQRALAEQGLASAPAYIRTAETNASHVGRQVGYDGVLELVDMHNGPSAVLCTSSTIAIGALHALQDRGITIPDRMALVTFGNPEWSTLVRPPLTVVTQPTLEMGRQAAQVLLDVLAGQQATVKPGRIILEPQLVVRASSVAAARLHDNHRA